MRRFVVVGTSGSGKTTFAAALAKRLGVPHVELDALHWEPNWVEAAPQVMRARVAAAVAADGWVCDGNYSLVRDLVWPRADALVWLDYPMGLTFWRVLSRTLRRAWRREVLWAGNRESLAKAFLSGDSILLWMLTTWRRNRCKYRAALRRPEYRHLRVYRFRRPRDAEAWLNALPPAGGGHSPFSNSSTAATFSSSVG